ncbi:M20/M25/M40 family metallo-hydrolase, partial [Halobium palmae]
RVAIRGAGGDPRLLRKTGTSDMNLFAQAWDCPMATYGPGDSALDHAPNEHLSLPEFDRSVEVLTAVATDLQGKLAGGSDDEETGSDGRATDSDDKAADERNATETQEDSE